MRGRVPSALKQERIRSVNRRAVIDAIHRNGKISRVDLATDLGLSPSTITAITAPLVDQGVVVEAELATTTSVGRKPILLEIDYDFASVIGIKVTNVAIIGALTNLRAEPLALRSDALTSLDAGHVSETIAGTVRGLCEQAGVDAAHVLGIGLGLPGIVEPETGRVRHSPLLGWYGEPFAERLHHRIGLPILVENDVDALAAAQAWFGRGAQHQSFLVMTLGRGVGLGIVVDGRVHRGPHGGAGEIGHTVVTPIAPRVLPTVAGTLESFISDGAMLARLSALGHDAGTPPDPGALTRLADAGDTQVLDLLRDAGELIGLALANLVNVFAPSLIVLAGEGMRNGRHLLPHVQRSLERHAFGDLGQRLDLAVEAFGDDAWARGAAGLAAARFLQELGERLTTVAPERVRPRFATPSPEGGAHLPVDPPAQS